MSLTSLPDELIVRIFKILCDDHASFKSLMLTSKRLCLLANGFLLVNSPEWVALNPHPIIVSNNLSVLESGPCALHGTCSELYSRIYSGSKVTHPVGGPSSTRRAAIENFFGKLSKFQVAIRNSKSYHLRNENDKESASDDGQDETSFGLMACVYHRLRCILQARFITYSSLVFSQVTLISPGCVWALRDPVNHFKINAIVELELNDCFVRLDWLDTILNELTRIAYLALNNVSFCGRYELGEWPLVPSRRLERLMITGNRELGMSDLIFYYFLNNYPATEFNLTGARIEFCPEAFKRHYHGAETDDILALENLVLATTPAETTFSLPVVVLYLLKHKTIVKRLVMDRTGIPFQQVIRILRLESLKDLKISAKRCKWSLPKLRRHLASLHVTRREVARFIF